MGKIILMAETGADIPPRPALRGRNRHCFRRRNHRYRGSYRAQAVRLQAGDTLIFFITWGELVIGVLLLRLPYPLLFPAAGSMLEKAQKPQKFFRPPQQLRSYRRGRSQ